MNDYLSSASVILHVVGKTKCLLTEDRGKFLLLFDLLFVKDPAELIECILCVTTERRDILRRILLMRRYTARWLLLTSPSTGIEMVAAKLSIIRHTCL